MNDAKRIIIAILITLLAIVVGFNFRAAITSEGAETARLANTRTTTRIHAQFALALANTGPATTKLTKLGIIPVAKPERLKLSSFMTANILLADLV